MGSRLTRKQKNKDEKENCFVHGFLNNVIIK